jgi:hypothetical protein
VPGVATVDTTGLVTAVGFGSTQIIARAVQDTTKRDSAQVTVALLEYGIWIARVMKAGTNNPVSTGNVSGQIDVVADLQRPPGFVLRRIEFLMDYRPLDGTGGRPNCTHTFTSGNSAIEVDDAAEEIVCSLNAAVFPNGNHVLSVRAVLPNGNVVASSGLQLTFNNPN